MLGRNAVSTFRKYNNHYWQCLLPFSISAYVTARWNLCFGKSEACEVYPSEQSQFLAQSLQSPNTDNYTVCKLKEKVYLCSKAEAKV